MCMYIIIACNRLNIKAGGAVYVTRCSPVEVIPRSHRNCTEEIPVTGQRDGRFRGPDQLRDQERWIAHTLQRCGTTEVQGGRQVVL